MKPCHLFLLSILATVSCFLEHGQQEEDPMMSAMSQNEEGIIVFDLSNIDHANGAEIPKDLEEEDTKILPTNIDFAAFKQAYAKENKSERFLPSRLFFREEKEN